MTKQPNTKRNSSLYKFSTRASAQTFQNNATKPVRVMLGDDKMFWVTTPANAERLHKAGYEYAI